MEDMMNESDDIQTRIDIIISSIEKYEEVLEKSSDDYFKKQALENLLKEEEELKYYKKHFSEFFI
jgi:hypothetical protein